MSDTQCAHCKLDTGGNHEWNCPLHPHNRPIITFTGGSTQYVYIECPDCQSKDKELQLLRSRLTIAMEALRAIEGHEHSRFPECDDSYEMTEMEQTGFGQYLSGCGHGHRCCAAIAREGLKKMEEVK